jgi:hypothetical protein
MIEELLNVDGGAIAIGRPFGMTGAQLAGHRLIEGKRCGVKYAVVTMCIAGGMGAQAAWSRGVNFAACCFTNSRTLTGAWPVSLKTSSVIRS